MSLRRHIAGSIGLPGTRRFLAIGLAAGLQLQTSSVTAEDLPTNASPASGEATNVVSAPLPVEEQTNPAVPPGERVIENFNTRLATAHYFEKTGQADKAEPVLLELLGETVPEPIRQTALFELGAVVRMENDLPRAESICAQFLDRWSNDPRVPEVLLRQGQIFRQMGLDNLALAKFYAVMTAALQLKSDRPDYYPALVLNAQMEIAETHYRMGRFGDAADFYSRLIQQADPALDRRQAQFRLIRSLEAVSRHEEVTSQARDFLSRFPDAVEQPEVRFYLAQSLKSLGENNDALQQVLLLLQEEKTKTRNHPETWAYWQQRAGNEIANQLYQEGDYLRALEIYINLAQLNPTATWQLPVKYQIGLTYERLEQPQKAAEVYDAILKLEPELSTNSTPAQQAVFDMARWRAHFIAWQNTAEAVNRSLARSISLSGNSATNSEPAHSLP